MLGRVRLKRASAFLRLEKCLLMSNLRWCCCECLKCKRYVTWLPMTYKPRFLPLTLQHLMFHAWLNIRCIPFFWFVVVDVKLYLLFLTSSEEHLYTLLIRAKKSRTCVSLWTTYYTRYIVYRMHTLFFSYLLVGWDERGSLVWHQ